MVDGGGDEAVPGGSEDVVEEVEAGFDFVYRGETIRATVSVSKVHRPIVE